MPLIVSVKLDAELIFPVVGSLTAGEPALLIVVVDEPNAVTCTV